MKKPMKFKRYEGGGEISGEANSKEPEDKRSFLERMKSDFSRITAGNIDDPKSEAYKKYGAGRNAVERDESVSINEPRSQFTRREPVILPYKPSEETMKRNTSGMDVQDESGMVNKRLKRNPETGELYDTEVTAPSVKPNASKPMGKREVGESVSGTPTVRNKMTAPSLGNDDYGPSTSKAPTQPSLGNDDYGPSSPKESKASPPSAVKPKPAAETSKKPSVSSAPKTGSKRVPSDEEAAAARAEGYEKIKGVGSSIGDYFGNLTSTSRYMKKKPEGEYRHGGKVKKMASGGMTSSASKRADGIATKGKTRGRMC